MASCPADYDWARNSQGMDPCTVASRLKDVCRTDPSLAAIPKGQSYSPPSAQDQTACSCSSPVYYLVAACADCQGGRYSSWKAWSAHCSAPAVDYYPRPAPDGVAIPNWAYFDVGQLPTYDPSFAKANSPSPTPRPITPDHPTTANAQTTPLTTTNGNSPATVTSIPVSSTVTVATTGINTDTDTDTDTGTNSVSDSSTGTATATSTDATGRTDGSSSQTLTSDNTRQSGLNAAFSSDTLTGPGHSRISNQPTGSSGVPSDTASGAKKGNTGPIVGGVIGALLLLVVLGGVLYWWIVRRRRVRVAPSAAYIAAYGAVRPDTSMSSRPLADRSNSVLNIHQGNADSYLPYRDEDGLRGSTLALASQPHQGHASRASSLDHYRMS